MGIVSLGNGNNIQIYIANIHIGVRNLNFNGFWSILSWFSYQSNFFVDEHKINFEFDYYWSLWEMSNSILIRAIAISHFFILNSKKIKSFELASKQNRFTTILKIKLANSIVFSNILDLQKFESYLREFGLNLKRVEMQALIKHFNIGDECQFGIISYVFIIISRTLDYRIKQNVNKIYLRESWMVFNLNSQSEIMIA